MSVIFLHGLGQTASSWTKTAACLSASTEFLCPDLFPMLKSRKFTYSNLYGAFSDYCGAISEKIDLCGLSLGAILALHYAIDNPTRVKSLVLIAPQYKMPRALLKIQNGIFSLLPKSAFLETGLSKQDMISFTRSTLDLDFTEQLGKISCKTLILCGEKDNANKKASVRLAEKIPGAGIQLVEGAGHALNTEAPEKLGKILNGFYEQN